MRKGYPLQVENHRELPADYSGPLCIWDIDKTYLSTHFSSMKGIAKIPLEYAVDKVAIPGMPAVLKGLRRGPGPEFACVPLYFVSASPVQMGEVLKQKMLLDGVEYDGIVLKDWLKAITSFRFGKLKEQVGYKLNALLSLKQFHPMAEEYLFGDDYEKDARVFTLYARILNGDVNSEALERELVADKTVREDRENIYQLIRSLPTAKGAVKKVYIHLEKKSPPENFREYGPLVVPVKGAFQLALALYEINKLDEKAVKEAMQSVPNWDKRHELIEDCIERVLISPDKLNELNL